MNIVFFVWLNCSFVLLYIHSLIQMFCESAHHVPDIVLGTWDRAVNKMGKILALIELIFLNGGDGQ